MSDISKLDSYFREPQKTAEKTTAQLNRRSRTLRIIKLALPSIAALLVGLLIVIPRLSQDVKSLAFDATLPKKGELEKLHMENSIFYITDYKNKVNNFHADTLDETEPGSKIIKMVNPRGTLPTTLKDEVTIQSPVGFFDQNAKLLTLQDGVILTYSSNNAYTVTQKMFVNFNTGKAYGNDPVSTRSDIGNADAEGFEYYKDNNLLVYTGKTHIVLRSGTASEGARP